MVYSLWKQVSDIFPIGLGSPINNNYFQNQDFIQTCRTVFYQLRWNVRKFLWLLFIVAPPTGMVGRRKFKCWLKRIAAIVFRSCDIRRIGDILAQTANFWLHQGQGRLDASASGSWRESKRQSGNNVKKRWATAAVRQIQRKLATGPVESLNYCHS